ncbi:MAG: hypothetical protein MUE71_10955, partial [Chitinophagaceae bacterium]|nr:hypothetical protein [Chitinophagaceae bacterium]
EQLRMQDDFDFTFVISQGLEEQVEIPPMLLQPFVENAIIHGLKPLHTGKKQLQITIGKEKGKIIFNIWDNGIGRSAAEKNATTGKHHQSMGTKLTGDRLKMMEQVLPIKTNYYYTDLLGANGEAAGTNVTIELTYLNEQE